jgi:hypothetical protein
VAQPETKAQYISAIKQIAKAINDPIKPQQAAEMQSYGIDDLKGVYADFKKAAAQQQRSIKQAMGKAQGQKQQKRSAASSRKSHSTRGKGRARKASDITFKSKTGGKTSKASQAKNKTVIVQALKKQGVKANTRMTRAQLQAKLTQANRKKTVRKTKSGAKFSSSARAGGVSPALKKDYNRVRGLMQAPNYALSTRLAEVYASGKKANGRLVVSQQMINKALKPRNLDSFQSAVAEERYQMFLEFYKPLLKQAGYSTARGTMGKLTKAGRRMLSKSKSKSKSRRKSVADRYESLSQQQRIPYYVAPRLPATKPDGTRRSPRRAPFRVLAVAGSGAPAFTTLDAAEQRRILNRLNGSAKSLRAKGAPRSLDIQAWFDWKNKAGKFAPPKSKSKGRKSRKSKSVASKYKSMPQSQRVPYYIARSPVRRLKPPFVVRAIPGTGAKPFRQLPRAKQQTILRQLNGGAKSLRGKGAPRKVNAQELFSYYDKKGRWAPRGKKGSGNRR